jgi:hypothetical protein
MTQPYDLDRRVPIFLEEGPAVLNDRILDLVRQDIHGVRQRRRPRGWRIGPMSLSPLNATVAIGAVTLMLGLAFMGWWLGRSMGDPPPATPAVWTGPVRSDAMELPVIAMQPSVFGGPPSRGDARDASLPWADITQVAIDIPSQTHWIIELAGPPPPAGSLDPEETVISYGLVFDVGADGVPDFEVGINNDTPTPGRFRVWVTNLVTGQRSENDGPAYGFPVEFSHPDELRGETMLPEAERRKMVFTFLGGHRPLFLRPGTLTAETPFYAWASVTRNGEVVAWDYAADSGWLGPSPDTAPQ